MVRSRANEQPTTVLAEISSTLYEPVIRNKEQLIINVLLVF
jgi:hypothetical protein